MRTFTQKLAFLLLALFCVVGVQLKADDLTVNDGTTTNEYVPIRGYYGDTSGKSQFIVPSDDLSDIISGTITGISFYSNYDFSFTGTWQVKLKEVSGESLSSSFVDDTDATLVYEGEIAVTSGVASITFSDGFSYLGEDLLVEVYLKTTGNYSPSGSLLWYGVSAQSASARYNGGAVAFLPKVTFEYTPGSGSSCARPETFEASNVTAGGAVLTWSGGSGTYNLEYKKASADKWTVALESSSLTSFTLTGLESNTAYQARVNCVCGGDLSSYKTISFTTSIALPYVQPFDASSIPSGWSQATGILNTDGSATLSTSTSAWSFGTGSYYGNIFGSSHAYGACNYYSTATYHKWLITPVLPMEEGLQLSFDLALTNSSGSAVTKGNQSGLEFVVLYTLDGGTNWTELRRWNNSGSAYVFDDISSTGEEVELDLSSLLTAGTAQFAFHLVSSTSATNYATYIHIDNVRIGAIPTCKKPTGLTEVAGKSTKNSIQVDWTPVTSETAWKVQYKKASDSEWSVLDAASHPFTISGLLAFTEYNVRVASVCGDELTDYGKQITVKTAAGVPFEQAFNISSLPADWKRYEGLWEEIQNGEELVSASSGWNTVYKTYANANGVYPDSTYHLFLNIAGANCKSWLVSPIIEMEAGYQLSFNLSLTPRSATSPAAVTPGAQNDDQFILAIYDADNGWTPIRTWDNSSSAFDNIKGTANGELIKISLDAYAGKAIQIAFYGESTTANGDNNLHIQNVKIATIPACENTTSLEVTAVGGTTASLVWDAVDGATWQYFYVVKPEGEFTPTDDKFTNSTDGYSVELTGLSENTDYVFYFRRKCGDTEYSDILAREFKTIQTPAAIPFSDNFEGSNCGWLLINGAQTNAWAWGAATQNGGAKSLYISKDGGDSNEYEFGSSAIAYATKTFTFDEAGVYSFSFDWKAYGEEYWSSPADYLRVVLAPSNVNLEAGSSYSGFSATAIPTGWFALDGGVLYKQSDWQHVGAEVNIEDAGTYKVIMMWLNDGSGGANPPAAIDNFSISRVLCNAPSGLAVSDLSTESATIEWNDDNDGNTWAYAYVLAGAAEPEQTAYTDIDQNSILIEGLPYNTAYTFYLRKHCGENYSDYVSIPFKTVNPYEVTINKGTTTNSYIPFYGYQADYSKTYSQFIIPADSLTAIQWDTIQSLTFYLSSPASKDFDPDRFSVFMKEVPATTMSAITDTATMTKVVNAKAVVIDDSKMVIELDNWFPYADGNLLIAFNQTVNGTYASTSWYGSSASYGASVYGYGTYSPSLQSFLPKMTIAFKTGVTPACLKPIELDTITVGVTTNSIAIEWTTGSLEQYWLVQYKKASESEWKFVPDSVKTPSYTITGLDASSLYNIRVASWCDPQDSTDVTDYCAPISIATECVAIASFPWSENFDAISAAAQSYGTPSEQVLPTCWSAVNTSTYSSYKNYPTVFYYSSYPGYANSTPNSLRFYSYYGSSYDPQDQYAILPEMDGISDLRIRLNARAYSTGSSYDAAFAIGVMTDPADTSTFVFVDSIKPASTTYAPFEIRFNEYAGAGKYIAIKMDKATSAVTTHGFFIDDVIVDPIPSCDEAKGLAVDTIGATIAVLKWDNEASGAWKYAYALASAAEPADDAFVAITDTFVQLSGLTDNAQYKFYLRHDCGSDVYSPSISISFQTKQLPATVPYANDFESGCDWQFINGALTNAWAYGEAAHNGDGTHALYISNDGGATHAYTNNSVAVVYAARLFNFEAGNYQFSYDWLANGESTYDYLRVALVPASVELTAGTSLPTGVAVSTLPANWIALDGGSQLNLQTAWQNFTSGVVAVPAGQYNVVLLWRDDTSGGTNPPAAVDNFSISKISCIPPTNLAAELTPGNGTIAALSWTAGESESAWVLEYSSKADMSDSISLEVSALSYELTGLTAETTYYARVKAVCGENDESGWSSVISFTPTNALNLTINNGTQTSSLVPIASSNLYTYYYAEGSKSQFIIPADSLTDVQWGKIKQLTFFSSSATFSFGDATFEAYMAAAPATTFASDAFVDWNSLTKVMNAASLTVEGNKMVVTLDEPYDYVGGDLLIGVKSVASAYVSSSCYWQGITATNAAIASEYDYDYYYDEYYEEPTRQNFLPKMNIAYLPGEEPSCLKPTGLTVTYNGGDSAVVNWTSDAASWNIDVNGVVTAVSAKPYTIHGLSLSTAYAVKVQAVCAAENLSEWTSAQSFVTDVCNAEDQQPISYILSDSYGDGWNGGATLKVIHKATSKEIAALTLSGGSSSNGTLPLCCGEEYSFVWVSGTFDTECSFVIKDVDDAIILSQSSPTAGSLGDYTMVCPSCIKPSAVVIPDSTITATTAVVHWTAGHSSQTVWQLAYDTLSSNQPDTLPTFKAEVTVIPDTLKNLLPEHTYFVYVRAYCGPNDSSKWASVKSFTTASLCQKPSGLAQVGSTVSSLTISWNTFGQTGFNLRYGTDGVNWTTVNDIATSPYTIEGLTASTSYKVQVQAACAAAEENSWTTSLTAKTTYGIPFEEPFSASSIPADWKQYTGLLSDIQAGASLSSATYGWSFGTANGIFDSHAKVNIYSTSTKNWLVTPTIQVDGNVQLTFDLALSYWSGTLVPVTAGQQADDKFVVLVSADEGATWTVLRQWDNAGSEYVYDNIACTADGEPVAINLAAYNGQSIQLAFYGESTVAGGDNYLHVDNVLVDLIPTCLKPTKLNVSDVKAHSAKLAWTAGEEGQTAWQIAIDSVDFKPDTLSAAKLAEILIDVTDTPYVVTGLDTVTTYYVYVRANCGSEDGFSKWSDKKSFTTTVACPAPTGFKAYLVPGDGAVAGLKWNAGDAESWTVQYGTDNTFADGTYVELGDLPYDTIGLSDLTAEATYYARVKANCGSLDGESEWSNIISFVPTNKYHLLINDSTATNEYVPVYGYYADNLTRSQFIIPATSLEAIQWDTIKHLTFYTSSPASVDFGAATFEVFVAEVDETTFASTTLYDWAEMDTVMAAGSLTVSGNKMEVEFTKPYQYQDGNLMIGFKQGVKGNDTHTYWYGVTATGASLSGYQGTYTSISQRNFLPKMLIEYAPGIEPACKDPKHLALDTVTAHSARFSWDAQLGANWQYAVVLKGQEPSEFEATTANTVEVENLSELTEYVFYLRRNCGDDGFSHTVSVEFMTEAHITTVPFEDDFEGANYWKLNNGSLENAWVIGDAVAYAGNRSIYISNNGGSSNEYTFDDAQAAVFATLLIRLDKDSTYVFQYDWKCEGEYYEGDGALDYLRVAIVPATVETAAGATPPAGFSGEALPTSWIALDGGQALVEHDAWQHASAEAALAAGQYKVVLAWVNDESDGNNPAAAIDNFSITYKESIPTGLNGGAVGAEKAIKFIHNDKVYILVNGVIYNITGQRTELR